MTTTATDLRYLAHRFVDDVINARDLDGALVELVDTPLIGEVA